MAEKAILDLEKALGKEKVKYEEFMLSSYRMDGSVYWAQVAPKKAMPIGVVFPHSTQEVQEVVRIANEHKVPVVVGGGRVNSWGALQCDGAIQVDLINMNKVVDIDEINMNFTVQGGATVDQIDRELRPHGFTYFVHPTHSGPKGIGSEVSKCTFGANKCMFGHITKRLLGLEVVLGNGDIIRTGSSRAIKNKFSQNYLQAGLPDLTSLFVAAEGAYGIITEETQHMIPLPVASGYLDGIFESTMDGFSKMMDAAIELRHKGLVSTMWLIDVYAAWRSFRGFAKSEGRELIMDEETALKEFGHIIMLDYDSFYSEEECKLKEKAIKQIIGKHGGGIFAEGEKSAGYLMNSIANPLTYGDAYDESCFRPEKRPWNYVWAEIPYTACVEDYAAKLKAVEEVGFPKEDFYYVIIANPDAAVPFPTTYVDFSNAENVEKWKEVNDRFFRHYADIGCVPVRIGRMWRPYILDKLDPTYKEYIMRVKKMFDPNNIMNPGVSVFDEKY